MKRTAKQWLEMIARTKPSAFAVTALEKEFTQNAVSDDLSQTEMLEIRRALEHLANQSLESQTLKIVSDRPQMTIDYRSEGMGGHGRLYLEIFGHEQLEALESEELDPFQIYVFMSDSSFAGLQVDNANTLFDRLEKAAQELYALELPLVDCVEADLENVNVIQVLEWTVRNRISR
jgi:hypothetical protein